MPQKMPEERLPSGEVWGPDGEPVRRTRAHARFGFVEPVESSHRHGRERALLDEECAWLANTRGFEE